jgi:uncharacterized membrane protein
MGLGSQDSIAWTASSNLCLCSYVKFSRRARDAPPDGGEIPPIDFSNQRNKRLTFPDFKIRQWVGENERAVARSAAAAERERARRRSVPETRHRRDRREHETLNDAIRTRQRAGRVDSAIKRKGADSVEEKAEDQDGMEQAEHDLLADLRRARRSLRLQDMDEPPAVARLTPGQRIADAVATVMGSWSFIIVQSAILFVWITANLVGAMRGWDPYPFILHNLALSFQAAYAAPVIMMSQNRQQDIDRKAAESDYRINVKAELEIELLHEKIDQLREREVLKLTESVRMLTELLEQSASGPREPDPEGGRPS